MASARQAVADEVPKKLSGLSLVAFLPEGTSCQTCAHFCEWIKPSLPGKALENPRVEVSQTLILLLQTQGASHTFLS